MTIAHNRGPGRSRAIVAALLVALSGPGCGPPASGRSAAIDPVAEDPPVEDPAYAPDLVPVVIEEGGPRLLGSVFVAGGPGPHPTVILLHGFPGHETNHDLARVLQRAGWSALVFHYRGSWGSEGTFSFEGALADVHRALRYLRDPDLSRRLRSDPERIVLAGHSFGGFLALTVAAADPRVIAAASIAGFDMGAHARAMAERDRARIQTASDFAGAIAPLHGATAEGLVAEILANGPEWSLTSEAARLADRPVLLVAGARDALAPRARHHHPLVLALRGAGTHSLTEVTLDDDHDLSAVRVALARSLVAWLGDVERQAGRGGSTPTPARKVEPPLWGIDVPNIRP